MFQTTIHLVSSNPPTRPFVYGGESMIFGCLSQNKLCEPEAVMGRRPPAQALAPIGAWAARTKGGPDRPEGPSSKMASMGHYGLERPHERARKAPKFLDILCSNLNSAGTKSQTFTPA